MDSQYHITLITLEGLQASLEFPEQCGMTRSSSARAASFHRVCFTLFQTLTFLAPDRKRKQHLPFPPWLTSKSARKPFPGCSFQRMTRERASTGGPSTCLSHRQVDAGSDFWGSSRLLAQARCSSFHRLSCSGALRRAASSSTN